MNMSDSNTSSAPDGPSDQVVQQVQEHSCERDCKHTQGCPKNRKQTEESSTKKKYTVGKITYYKDSLGSGRGTKVFRGTFEGGRDAAIKRILMPSKAQFKISDETLVFKPKGVEREIKINHEMDMDHKNIVKYMGYEISKHGKHSYIYIALQLCQFTLTEYILNPRECPSLKPQQVVIDMATGLQYLHQKEVIHRDLKPSNILIKDNKDGTFTAKLCDFGHSKYMMTNMYSISGEFGSPAWIAPEVWPHNYHKEGSSKSDIFSLGLLFYYVESEGEQYFEDQDAIQAMKSDDESFDKVQHKFRPVLKQMLDGDPEERPDIDTILKNPALWSQKRIHDFLIKASDALEDKKKVLSSNEEIRVTPPKWREKLTPLVIIKMEGSRRTYSDSDQDLLRLIRNLSSHYATNSDLHQELGSHPDGFTDYWMTKFPQILIAWYDIMKRLKNNAALKEFYQ